MPFKDYYLLEQRENEFLTKTLNYLEKKNKVLMIVTSNRWQESEDIPKSTTIANYIKQQLGAKKCSIIDATKLKIYDCEGNVSDSIKGNHCGTKQSVLKDKEKNPSGCHRCWASINHKDDELWKISKQLFESDAVIFFGSVRWGQANAVYSRLLERLTWLENRHTTLKESNIIKDIEAGCIFTGQNWNGSNVIKTQQEVLRFFGFKVPDVLSWNWQYTENKNDETKQSYDKAAETFKKEVMSSSIKKI